MNSITGTLGILNVGAGDVQLSFDPTKPAERRRAAKIVTDMIRQGFAILVKVGEHNGEPTYQRAKAFDEKTCEYIVAGGPAESINIGKTGAGPDLVAPVPPRRGRPRKADVRLPAARTHAVSVARSAGG